MKDAQPSTVRLGDYTPPSHRISATDLTFELADGATRVTSRLEVSRDDEAAADLVLAGKDMTLEEVRIDGEALSGNRYRLSEESLTLFDVPARAEISVVTTIVPQRNTALEGLYKSGGMYCTQCEAEGFRKITYYLDRPDVLSRFRTTIIADDRYPVLLANGNCVHDSRLADGRRRVVWEDPFPKPSYLFALVAGDLAVLKDSYTTASGRTVALEIYSEPHNIGQCEFAMGALKRAMRWDEERFGREYDLDVFMIVAVDDFNMGAMENKGLNIFNTAAVLATPDTATDAAYRRIEGIVGHEYFHNWSGNRVTVRDWFQLSLKEGFTVFRDAEFTSDLHSRTVKRIEDVNQLRTIQFPEDAGPMAHPVRPDSYIEISNFYTPTVYEKGAEVVRMLHRLLGEHRFRRGSDLYFDRHDGAAVTTEDFVKAMEDANDVDLAQFRRWYSQAGTPVLRIDEQRSDDLVLTIDQECPATPGQPDKAPQHVPFALGLVDEDGRDMLGAAGRAAGYDFAVTSEATLENPDEDGTLMAHVTAPRTRIAVRGVGSRGVVSVLRGFSAPVKVRMSRSPEALAVLARLDTDGFNRWDAVQQLVSDAVLADDAKARDQARETVLELFARLTAEAEIAADDGETKAMLTALLTLPSEAYLHEQSPVIDVDGTHTALEALRTDLAGHASAAFARLFDHNAAVAPYSPDAPSAARRGLANTALSYLVADRDAARLRVAAERVRSQLERADNLTERLAALRALLVSPAFDDSERERRLTAFFERWQGETLVVNQWLAVQAIAPRPNARARLEALEQHPAFEITNPNKVRAVYGAFVHNNHVGFHAADGTGYGFLIERVERLNAINPSVAARLLTPLTRWRRFDHDRREAMRAALERLASADGLSKDVFEVVSKSLAD